MEFCFCEIVKPDIINVNSNMLLVIFCPNDYHEFNLKDIDRKWLKNIYEMLTKL